MNEGIFIRPNGKAGYIVEHRENGYSPVTLAEYPSGDQGKAQADAYVKGVRMGLGIAATSFQRVIDKQTAGR